MTESDKQFALLKHQVQANCRFVRNVTMMDNDIRWVYVELVEGLHEFLPKDRWTMIIARERFSEQLVREVYETNVVEWFQRGYEKAEDLAVNERKKRNQ